MLVDVDVKERRDSVLCGLNDVLGYIREGISAEFSVDDVEPEADYLVYLEGCVVRAIDFLNDF